MRAGYVNGLIIGLACLGVTSVSDAQTTTEVHPGQGGSPHVKTEWTIGSANVSIEYGRPYLKGRHVGQELAPYGKVWRTGADEATTLVTDTNLMFGSTMVAPGTYTLYTVPGESAWTLVINKQTGQWGTEYNEDQDLIRVEMAVEEMSQSQEQLTLKLEADGSGGVLAIEWDTTRASVPFMIH